MRIGEVLACILFNRLCRAVNRDGNVLAGTVFYVDGLGASADGGIESSVSIKHFDRPIVSSCIHRSLEGSVPVTIHLRHSCGLRRDSKRTESMGVREGGGHLSARFAYLCLILIAFVLNINILRLINKPLRQRNRNCRLSVNR